MRTCLIGAAAAGTALLLTLYARDARACGGCFHRPPPPQQQQQVTVVHRMIFVVTKTSTTLYDQIEFQGDPAEFAWVLPIKGTVKVALSSDAMFGSLDTITRTSVIAPPEPVCPPPPICAEGSSGGGGSGCGCGVSSRSSFDESASADASFGGYDSAGAYDARGVTIEKQEVVGPYETVQIKATDPMSLTDWLAMNQYIIADDVKPLVTQYQNEGFGFLALKLKPGSGIRAMRPVSVTSPGAALALPLRMVAAGTGATVGISLWIVGEGRYEPQNFPSFRIRDDELFWDWSTRRSNYAELRDAKTRESGGFAWEVESSLVVQRQTLEGLVTTGGRGGFSPTPAELDYDPVMDPQSPKTAEQVRREDLDTVLGGLTTARITRVRADLSRPALATDLTLTASQDLAPLTSVRNVTNERNRPACPTYAPCPEAPEAGDGARGGAACAQAQSPTGELGPSLFAASLLSLVLRRRRGR